MFHAQSTSTRGAAARAGRGRSLIARQLLLSRGDGTAVLQSGGIDAPNDRHLQVPFESP